MKNIMTGLSLLMGLSGLAVASDNVDLLILVEPSVYDSISNESLHHIIDEQIAYSNSEYKEFDVNFRINGVVTLSDNSFSERLLNNESFMQSAGSLFNSMGLTEDEYNSEYQGDPWFEGRYDKNINELINTFSADKVLVFTNAPDTSINANSGEYAIGRAFLNKGLIVDTKSMVSNKSTVAHELGHTFGLGHVSKDECEDTPLLMCQGVPTSSGFNQNEKLRIKGVINNEPEYLVDYFDQRFWVGKYSSEKVYLSNVKLTVKDNPIHNDLDSTEVELELLDASGAIVPLSQDAKIDLFVKGEGFDASGSYDDTFYQSVTFMAGESTKRVDLNVAHGNEDVTLIVGARYGVNLADSNTVSVGIEKLNKNQSESDDEQDDKGDGGSLSFWSLLVLLFVRKRCK